MENKSKLKSYKTWAGIKQRCLNKKSPNYRHYGGRGIKICDRWMSFDNFYEDMGEKPDGLTIERINNDGDYEPSNCKWATYKEQGNNKRLPKRYGDFLREKRIEENKSKYKIVEPEDSSSVHVIDLTLPEGKNVLAILPAHSWNGEKKEQLKTARIFIKGLEEGNKNERKT